MTKETKARLITQVADSLTPVFRDFDALDEGMTLNMKIHFANEIIDMVVKAMREDVEVDLEKLMPNNLTDPK